MHKVLFSVVGLLAFVAITGCAANPNAPNYSGRLVSFSDNYGSDSYSSTYVTSPQGTATHGYGGPDPAKPDWCSDIKWEFVRHEKGNDIYRIEWTFQVNDDPKETGSKEIAFDGSHPAHVACNKKLQYLSIEPGLF